MKNKWGKGKAIVLNVKLNLSVQAIAFPRREATSPLPLTQNQNDKIPAKSLLYRRSSYLH
ncbi:hypothetical protein [Myxosarcina sp. GI1(2024)]